MVSKAEDHEAQEADDVRAVEQLPHAPKHAVTTRFLYLCMRLMHMRQGELGLNGQQAICS